MKGVLETNLRVDLHIDNVTIESGNISQVNSHEKGRMTHEYSGGIA
jgi:hypothetical protein